MEPSAFPLYLLTIVVTWVLAHIIKYAIALGTKKALKFKEQVFASGGMPSAHAATVMSLATVIGLAEGINSAAFAVTALLLLIVTHDAVRVRLASGRQGDALVALIKEVKSTIELGRSPKGHTIPEVAAGWVLGLIVGIAMFAIFQ